jgi:hypothetical protein
MSRRYVDFIWLSGRFVLELGHANWGFLTMAVERETDYSVAAAGAGLLAKQVIQLAITLARALSSFVSRVS